MIIIIVFIIIIIIIITFKLMLYTLCKVLIK